MTEAATEDPVPPELYFRERLLTAGRRIRKSPYLVWFVVFICAQLIFLYGVKNNLFVGMLSVNGIEEMQTAFFIVSVNVLLAINTLVFLYHVMPLLSSIDGHIDLENKHRATMKEARIMFTLAMVVAVGLCAIIAAFIGLKMSGSLTWSWPVLVKLSEVVSGVVFGLFLFADLCCLEAAMLVECNYLELNGVDLKKIRELIQSLQRYLLAVDTPGFIGIVIIVLSSHVIFPSVQVMYWEGFTAGAIGLHIMFSQVALLLLSALENEH